MQKNNRKKLIIPSLIALLSASCTQTPDFKGAYGIGPIYPDYIDVTVPATIAPLNFVYTDQKADAAITTFTCGNRSYTFRGREIEWKCKQWKKLLEEAQNGGEITVTSTVPDTTWTIHVSPDPIDFGIAYRLLAPGYETAGLMGIYERDLSSFKEIPILENTQFDCCMNCHTFNQCDPQDLSIHIRGGHSATLIRKDGKLTAYNTTTDSTLAACVYPYWHPSGNYIVYSTNETRQSFHMEQGKPLDVYDVDSDLQIYDIRNNTLITAPRIKAKDMWENYPAFSADGKWLYFCSTPACQIPEEIDSTRYNLCRVSFDEKTGTIGSEVETVIDAASMGKCVAFPRPSYDGKYIMYTLFDNTAFPIWHDEADLWVLNLETGQNYPLERANSDGPDGYHSWSSNSRWFVFGSRRDDGRYTRAYIGHLSEDGTCDKAFMLPQEHPLSYYAVHSRSFNLPEFITGHVNLDKVQTEKTVTSADRTNFGFRWSD